MTPTHSLRPASQLLCAGSPTTSTPDTATPDTLTLTTSTSDALKPQSPGGRTVRVAPEQDVPSYAGQARPGRDNKSECLRAKRKRDTYDAAHVPAGAKTARCGEDEGLAPTTSSAAEPADAEIMDHWKTAFDRFRLPASDRVAECTALQASAAQLGAQLALGSSAAQREQRALRALDLLHRSKPLWTELEYVLPSLLGATGLKVQLSVPLMKKLLWLVGEAYTITPVFKDFFSRTPLVPEASRFLLTLANTDTPAASLGALLSGVKEIAALELSEDMLPAYMQSALKNLSIRLSTPSLATPQADCIARALLRMTLAAEGGAPWAALPAVLTAAGWPYEVLDASCQLIAREAASQPELHQAATDITASILELLDQRHATVYARIPPGSQWLEARLKALNEARHRWDLALNDVDARTDFPSQRAGQRLKALMGWYDSRVAPLAATRSAPAGPSELA